MNLFKGKKGGRKEHAHTLVREREREIHPSCERDRDREKTILGEILTAVCADSWWLYLQQHVAPWPSRSPPPAPTPTPTPNGALAQRESLCPLALAARSHAPHLYLDHSLVISYS